VSLFAFYASRWMEEDPMEILQSVHSCIEQTIKTLKQMKIPLISIKG